MYLIQDFINSRVTLTDKLLKLVSDYDIYCELIGMELNVGSPIRSPIRDNDSSPSFSLFFPTKFKYAREEEIWWTDYTIGSGNVFDFVQHFVAYHHSIDLKNRYEIVEYIDSALDLGLLTNNDVSTYQKRELDYVKEKETKSILFNSRTLTALDKYWWIEYGIDEPLLKIHNVRSLDNILNDDFTVRYHYRATELGFVYVVYDKVKIYSPYGGDFKWRNTCPADYLLGEEQLQQKDCLIITKSLKDIMVFKSFMDVDSVAPQSETNGLSAEKIASYKEQYKYIYVVMDWDEAGRYFDRWRSQGDIGHTCAVRRVGRYEGRFG